MEYIEKKWTNARCGAVRCGAVRCVDTPRRGKPPMPTTASASASARGCADADDDVPLLGASTPEATGHASSTEGARRDDGRGGRSDGPRGRGRGGRERHSTTVRAIERGFGARSGVRGHPCGLFVLGATEMWERFGYYAARAVLALYVTKILTDATFDVRRVLGLRALGRALVGYDFGHAFPNATSDAVGMQTRLDAAEALSAKTYGAYACLTYLTPVFGGILADAMLGAHRSALFGAAIMVVGYTAMASERFFLLGMLAVCIGNGAFKPSISTQLSALYAKDDPKRDGGFSIFYCCINIGAFFSPLIAGTVRVYFGYGAAFASAAVGMVCAMAIYTTNRKYVLQDMVQWKCEVEHREMVDEEFGNTSHVSFNDVEETHEDRSESDDSAAVSFMKILDLMRENANAVLAVVIVCVAGVGVSMVYEQQGSSLMLFSDAHINLYGLPTEFIAALNPALVLFLTPAVTVLWERQARSGSEPYQMTKIAIGSGLISLSFTTLMFGALPIESHSSTRRISMLWIVLNQIFLTAGELFVYPVALSYISKVSPQGLLSALIGFWFGSSFFGNYFSGLLGAAYPTSTSPSAFFAILAVISGAVSVVIAVVRAPLRRACPID